LLSRCCLTNDEGPGPQIFFPRTAPDYAFNFFSGLQLAYPLKKTGAAPAPSVLIFLRNFPALAQELAVEAPVDLQSTMVADDMTTAGTRMNDILAVVDTAWNPSAQPTAETAHII